MGESTRSLKLLAPKDWRLLRAVRLSALRDSPRAFTSSYAEEGKWDESQWRQVLETAIWVVASEAEKVIGLAKSVCDLETSTRHLESVWVAPKHRRCGVFRELLHALAEREREMGGLDLQLWVLEDNHVARQAYEALGFESTGESQPLPALGKSEHRLRLRIGNVAAFEVTTFSMQGNNRSSEPDLRPDVEAQEVHDLLRAADDLHVSAVLLPVP